MQFAWMLLACAFLYGWLEYFVHRFDMHKRGSLRFYSHTIRHHGRKEMGVDEASLTQKNAGIGFWFSLPVVLPIAAVWDWSFVFVWMGTIFWAGFTWTAVHRNIHDEPGFWYAWILCPWLPLVRWNHLRHHRRPNKSYGGLFWFLTDPIAGTFF